MQKRVKTNYKTHNNLSKKKKKQDLQDAVNV